MSQLQTINVGNIANDGTGDDLREAFIKVNNNLLYLENSTLEPAIEGNNLGDSGEGIYVSKDSNVLNFKELLPGENVTLSSNNSSITINSSGGISDILVCADEGSITVDENCTTVGGSSPTLNLYGGAVINTRTVPASGTVFIDLADNGVLAHDQSPRLSAPLQADFNNIQNVGNVNAQSFQGPLQGEVYGIDIRDINEYFDNNWDFGSIIIKELNSIIQYITLTTDVDLGTIEGSGVVEFDIDLGTL